MSPTDTRAVSSYSSYSTSYMGKKINQNYFLSNVRKIKYGNSETQHTTFCVIRFANRLWFRKQIEKLWCISKLSWKDEASDHWITFQIIFLTVFLCNYYLDMMGCCLVMLTILMFWRDCKLKVESCSFYLFFSWD